MVNIFSLLESFLFLFLGISFILVLLMVYHFKKRLDVMEKKNETLGDICKTMVRQIEQIKNEIVVSEGSSKVPKEEENISKSASSLTSFFNGIMHPQMSGDMFISNMNPYVQPSNMSPHVEELDIQEMENADLDSVESSSGSLLEETDDDENIELIDYIDTDNSDNSDNSDNIKEEAVTTNEPADTIQVTKLNETEVITEDDDLESFTDTLMTETHTKTSLNKMTVQILRTIVIRDGYSTEPSKLKKQDLIQLILSKNDENSLDI